MKEELRKEFVEEIRKGITFAGQVGDYVINQSLFDWFYSKLEAKDKEIAELKCDKLLLVDANERQFKQITDLKAKLEAAEIKERFEIPDDKTIIDFAILFNDGRLDPEQLSNMVGMCQMILDRLHEHGNVRQKSKQEIIDEYQPNQEKP